MLKYSFTNVCGYSRIETKIFLLKEGKLLQFFWMPLSAFFLKAKDTGLTGSPVNPVSTDTSRNPYSFTRHIRDSFHIYNFIHIYQFQSFLQFFNNLSGAEVKSIWFVLPKMTWVLLCDTGNILTIFYFFDSEAGSSSKLLDWLVVWQAHRSKFLLKNRISQRFVISLSISEISTPDSSNTSPHHHLLCSSLSVITFPPSFCSAWGSKLSPCGFVFSMIIVCASYWLWEIFFFWYVLGSNDY